MGICSSKKVKINNPSEHLTGDLDDELLHKNKHQELIRNYVINGDNLLLSLDFFAAIESYEKALEDLLVLQMQYDNSTFILSTLYQRIALAYRLNKKHEESLEWECKAVVAREKKLPETHEQVAGAYSSLSVAYEASGNYKEALKYCEKALKIRNKLFNANHWVSAISTERLGMLKAYEGDYEEAISLVIQAKQNLAAHFTEESCYVGYNHMRLGEIYLLQEKYEVAQEQFNPFTGRYGTRAKKYSFISAFYFSCSASDFFIFEIKIIIEFGDPIDKQNNLNCGHFHPEITMNFFTLPP